MASLAADALSQQILTSVNATPAVPKPAEVSTAEREKISNTLAQLPLSFEPNQGQSAAKVKYLAHAPGYVMQLTATEMRMLIKGPAEATAAADTALGPKHNKAPSMGITHALKLIWLDANADA